MSPTVLKLEIGINTCIVDMQHKVNYKVCCRNYKLNLWGSYINNKKQEHPQSLYQAQRQQVKRREGGVGVPSGNIVSYQSFIKYPIFSFK